jgi:hypothetical protein
MLTYKSLCVIIEMQRKESSCEKEDLRRTINPISDKESQLY